VGVRDLLHIPPARKEGAQGGEGRRVGMADKGLPEDSGRWVVGEGRESMLPLEKSCPLQPQAVEMSLPTLQTSRPAAYLFGARVSIKSSTPIYQLGQDMPPGNDLDPYDSARDGLFTRPQLQLLIRNN